VILTQLPDLLPNPETTRNAAFRRDFYRIWGKGNWVVSGHARHAEYDTFRQTLSIKTVAGGSESYFINRRRVTVTDDTFLILNAGREYASRLVAGPQTEAYTFSIFIRPGLAQEVAAGVRQTLHSALDSGPDLLTASVEFAETLRVRDKFVFPVVRFIHRGVESGIRDEHWLEEQVQFLAERMFIAQQAFKAIPARLSSSRPATRAELAKRLGWATDFMHSNLNQQLSLRDIAAAASLSPFHFLRQFREAYGVTPMAYLRDQRTRRARELLTLTTDDVSEIADQVGLSRVALWRSLRRTTGNGGRSIRRMQHDHAQAVRSEDTRPKWQRARL
jgi:AraC-like DNA-binding protein